MNEHHSACGESDCVKDELSSSGGLGLSLHIWLQAARLWLRHCGGQVDMEMFTVECGFQLLFIVLLAITCQRVRSQQMLLHR